MTLTRFTNCRATEFYSCAMCYRKFHYTSLSDEGYCWECRILLRDRRAARLARSQDNLPAQTSASPTHPAPPVP